MSDPRREPRPAAELAPQILDLLPAKQGPIAVAIGRKPSDGTVRRVLASLADAGLVDRVGGTWHRADELPKLPKLPEPWERLLERAPAVAGALAAADLASR